MAASDGYLYYGTDSGKLMRFDPVAQSVSEAACLSGEVLGYLIEDQNGDILGVVSGQQQQLFAYGIASGQVSYAALPLDARRISTTPALWS